jgi:hypothetical protein
MSFLSALGGDIKKVFGWMGGKGAPVIVAGEAIVEDVFPAATGLINIVNSWIAEAIKLQAMGDAAGATVGSDTTKATAVLSTLTPAVLAWATANKLPAPTAATLQAVNDHVVAILVDLSGAKAPAPATP